jgi:hypothetical protein
LSIGSTFYAKAAKRSLTGAEKREIRVSLRRSKPKSRALGRRLMAGLKRAD